MLERRVVTEPTGVEKETITRVIFKRLSLFCSLLAYCNFPQPIQIQVLSLNGKQHRGFIHVLHIFFINVSLSTKVFEN